MGLSLKILRNGLLLKGFFAAQLLLLLCCATPVIAQDKLRLEDITFLMPAPPSLVAFAPLTLAADKGYFRQAGLNVKFIAVGGGAAVGRQLAANNGDLGLGLGDTPILLRSNGIKIRGVALLGGRPLHQLVLRQDQNIDDLKELKGKTLTVLSYQDTSYFAALAVLASAGLDKNSVAIQATNANGAWQLVAAGKAAGLVGPPEWAFYIEREGVKTTTSSTAHYFPGMAQAVLASDDTIAKRPELVEKFVGAVLRSLDDIKRDPKAAAELFVAAQPSYRGQEEEIGKILTFYADHVYANQKKTGQFNRDVVAKLQDYYMSKGIIRSSVNVDDLYTNRFIH